MRGAASVIVQTHQILRLPRKMNLMIDPWHKWNVIYNARSNMRHSPKSPNTAPATKNDRPKSQRNLLKTDETSFPMRGRSENDPTMIREWSDHDPTMKPSVRNPPRTRGYFSRPPRAFCIEKYIISRSGYHSKFHRILRLPRKVTLQLHRILRLPRKVTLELHEILRLPRKVTLELHEILRLPRKVTLELHQLLRLPRKVTLELQQTEPLLDWAMTSLSYYLTDDTYYLTTPITWRHYLTTPTTWRHLLLDDITWRHYLTTPITWRHLLLDDTYYLTTLLDDAYYLTTLLDDITWRHLILDDT